jgi:hypothetical protein
VCLFPVGDFTGFGPGMLSQKGLKTGILEQGLKREPEWLSRLRWSIDGKAIKESSPSGAFERCLAATFAGVR